MYAGSVTFRYMHIYLHINCSTTARTAREGLVRGPPVPIPGRGARVQESHGVLLPEQVTGDQYLGSQTTRHLFSRV